MNNNPKESGIKIAIPCLDEAFLDNLMSPHFGESPAFMIATLRNNAISHTEALKNPNGNCFSLIDSLAKKSVKILLVANIGARPYLAALGRDIDVRRIPTSTTIGHAIESYIRGETMSFGENDVCPGKKCH